MRSLAGLAVALAALWAPGCAEAPRGRPPRAALVSKEAPPPALARDDTVTGKRFAYGLHLAPLPNLLYQLDCVAGAVVCAQVVFRDFWAARGLDAGDEAALVEWKALRTRYVGGLRRADVAPAAFPLLHPWGGPDLAERQRLAGLLARTPAAYGASVALLSSDADARRLVALLARFEPRFSAWWAARGFAAGSASFDAFARQLADPFLDATIERAAHFYEAELPPGPVLDVHLVVQPASRRQLTAAFQLEAYAIVEVPEGGRVETLLSIVAHEAFHYFFNRMAPARRAAFLGQIVGDDDPFAAAAYGVFDEAIACVLGNGVVGRHYATPEAFARRLARDDGLDQYREASLIARALLPSMGGFLERGTVASSDEFWRAFRAAARSTYAGGRPRPLDYLHAPTLVAGPRFAVAAEGLRDAAHAGFPYLREFAAFDAEAKAFTAERALVSAALLLPLEGGAVAAALESLAAPTRPGGGEAAGAEPGGGMAAGAPGVAAEVSSVAAGASGGGEAVGVRASGRGAGEAAGAAAGGRGAGEAAKHRAGELVASAAKHRAALAALAKRSRGFVYALPRTSKSYAFFFVANDDATMTELVRRFVELDAMREGALVELTK